MAEELTDEQLAGKEDHASDTYLEWATTSLNLSRAPTLETLISKVTDQQIVTAGNGRDLKNIQCFGVREGSCVEIEDNFKLFSKDGGEHVATKQLGTLIRSMGQHPTEAEIEDLIRLGDVEETGYITFPKFKTLLSRIIKDLDPEKQLRDAFRVFDKDVTGFIASSELRMVMSTLGEALTAEEVEEFIREADSDGRGFVSYEDFIQMMLSK